LAPEDRELVAEDQNLDILGPLGPHPEDEELQHSAQGYAKEREEHGRGFSHRDGVDANSPLSRIEFLYPTGKGTKAQDQELA
jgi:hypothetical protein